MMCGVRNDLSVMCMPFKDGAQGSRIILTTRSENVASNMGTVQIHRLQKLSDEVCWELFTTLKLMMKSFHDSIPHSGISYSTLSLSTLFTLISLLQSDSFFEIHGFRYVSL